jgi:N-acetylglucosamine malate deacetylase 1
MSVLVLAPHADDEVLGCGGVIRRHVSRGDRVTVVILTNAAVGAPELFASDTIREVREEAREAHRLLGVAESVFLDLPAPRLDQYPMYQLANEVAKMIAHVGPHTVYVPFRGDLHCDHGAVFSAAMVATRPTPGQVVRRVLAYETPSETEWAAPAPDTQFSPNHFVNIEHELVAKLGALSRFRSQLREFPHPRSLQAVEALARWRGASVGVAAAEAFWLVRSID